MVDVGPLTFREVTVADDADRLTEEEYQKQRAEERCGCAEPDNAYNLSIECGDIQIVHMTCGKPPWWMLDEFNECVGMDDITMTATVTGTEKDYNDEIDGPQIDLQLIKGNNGRPPEETDS